MNKINLAVDPGFGAFKTAQINGTPESYTLPSVVASGSMKVMSDLLSTGFGGKSTHRQPHTICFDGVSYLVGSNVHRYGRPIERLDFDRLSHGPELKALFFTSIWQALGFGQHDLNLLIGLPVEVLQDPNLSSAILSELRAWLIHDHYYTVDGGGIEITIYEIKALPQPLGAFFCWGTNNQGQWIQTDDPRAKIAVGDIGFNTLDLFVIEDAQVNERYSTGDTLGLRRAISFIRDSVRDEFGVNISFYEADQLIRARLAGRAPFLHTAQASTDITPDIDQALDDCFSQIATALEERWGNGRQFRRIILTGGGAEALRERLLRLYPRAIILPNAQTANAIGLAKFAQRPTVFG